MTSCVCVCVHTPTSKHLMLYFRVCVLNSITPKQHSHFLNARCYWRANRCCPCCRVCPLLFVIMQFADGGATFVVLVSFLGPKGNALMKQWHKENWKSHIWLLGLFPRVIHFIWVFAKHTRLKRFRKISHRPDRTRSVICFVKRRQCGGRRAVCVLHHWPAALDHMTFFDRSLFSCCEMSWWIQKPTVWLRERGRGRLHQTILLMSSLTFTAQQGPALRAPRSLVCFRTKLCARHLRCFIPWGGSQAAEPGLVFGLSSIVFPQSDSCFTFYPEASETSHEMLMKEKTEGSWQRFLSGHVFLNHCLKATRGATYLTSSAGHGDTSQVLNDTVVSFYLWHVLRSCTLLCSCWIPYFSL